MSHESTENDDELRLEIQRFSMQALALAKRVVDGSAEPDDQETATSMQAQLPVLAGRSKSLDEADRAAMNGALADARLDLQFVLAGGGIPSSIRLGQYMNEREAGAD